MLDELQEYRCCLEKTTSNIPLQQYSLDGGDGFRRLLRILAKGFLEKCEDQGLDREQSIRYCRGFLQTWVNGEIPKDLVIPDSCDKLLADLQKAEKNNLMVHAEKLQELSMKDKTQLPKRMDKLKADVSKYDTPPYQMSWNVKRNDFNRIYYDQIIADALNRKPLRKQCLVMKKDDIYGISCKENLRKIALAVVCMYLQDLDEFVRPVAAAYLPIVQAEVGNWLHVRVKKKDSKSEVACVALAMERACWKGTSTSLFDKQKMVNISKVRVDPDWLKEYGVKLVDAKDAENLPDDYVKFDDSYFCGK